MNKQNRPLSQVHVQRIAQQIERGLWQYNGDTIKIAHTNDVLDGQHRLWAIIEANKAVETIIVNGIDPGAFTTIDTLHKHRSYSDIIGMSGQVRHRSVIATALAWLHRWHSGSLAERTWKAPKNRIENEDVKQLFKSHPRIVDAVEATTKIRGIGNHGIISCFYYVLCCQDRVDLANRMVDVLEDPAAAAQSDPFFRLRAYFLIDHHKRAKKDPAMSFALMIKAANAAHAKKRLDVLSWRNQGRSPEEFPVLKVK